MNTDLLLMPFVFNAENGLLMKRNLTNISGKNTLIIGELAYGLVYHVIAVNVVGKLLQLKKWMIVLSTTRKTWL